MCGGAVIERLQDEIDKVLSNITDPNTEAKKGREITLKMKFQPNERRNVSGVKFSVSSKVVPAIPVETEIIIDKDGEGNAVAAELRKGAMKDQLEIDTDTGEVLENKVLKMR
jgi:hypothetical protein